MACSKATSGFVYVWYDRKHKRYYVGSHWGFETDGYICSSDWMRKSHLRRPEDFKRRIVKWVYTNRKDLLSEEYRWLSMIKPEEVKIRYYNLKIHNFGHWTSDESKLLTVGEKISQSLKGKRCCPATEIKKGQHLSPITEVKPGQRLSPNTEFKVGHVPKIKGKTFVEVYGERRAGEIQSKLRKTQFRQGNPSWNAGLSRIGITDGSINKWIYGEDRTVPDGWYRGYTKKAVA